MICIVYPAYPPAGRRGNGDAKYTEKLAQSLASQSQVEVIVITSKTEHHKTIYSPQGNLVIYPIVENWGLRGLMKGDFQKVKRTLKEVSPDIINIIYPDPHLNSEYLLPYFIKLISQKIPIITTLFHFFPKRGNVLYKVMAILLYLSSKKIHFHDEGFMFLFHKVLPFLRKRTFFIPVGNLVTVNNSTENATKLEITQKLNLPEGFRYISFVGYWYHSKGLDILLEAVNILKQKGLKLKLLLIGGHSKEDMNEYEKGILELVSKLNLQDDILLTGYCSDDLMVKYSLCSEVCVFPFRSNVMGRSSIMLPISLGLPIITTKLVKKSSFFIDRENVLLVPLNDPDALAQGIEEVLNNERVRNYIATNMRSLAERTSWENIANEWKNVYFQLLT